MIPHKVQKINDYICRCLALFFISGCIRLPEYHILQFHTSFLQSTAAGVDTVNDSGNIVQFK